VTPDDYATALEEKERELAQANAALAAEQSEHARLKRTVAFMERQYLASHGGSWGDCKYQVLIRALREKVKG